MKIYMKVTNDEYELPVAVAESRTVLAKMVGTTPETVSSRISHKSPGWAMVEIPESDVEEDE